MLEILYNTVKNKQKPIQYSVYLNHITFSNAICSPEDFSTVTCLPFSQLYVLLLITLGSKNDCRIQDTGAALQKPVALFINVLRKSALSTFSVEKFFLIYKISNCQDVFMITLHTHLLVYTVWVGVSLM